MHDELSEANADGAASATIGHITLAEIAAATRPDAHRVGTIVGEGAYQRRPMFHLEDADLDEAQRNLHAAYRKALPQTVHPCDHMIFREAKVVGQGSVVLAGGELVRESALEFLAQKRVPDGFVPSLDGRFRLDAPVARTITRPTVLIQRPWFENFGHWLVDGAAMLALLSHAALPRGWQIAIGAQPNDGMRDIVFESLALLVPGIGVVERPRGEVWQFRELHYFTPIHVPPLYKHPEGLAGMRAAVLRGQLAGHAGRRKLFICRGNGTSRRLDNEADIVRQLAERGFEIIPDQPRTLQQQAALNRSARIIVGVKGAALTNAMFAAAGTHLVSLSPGDFPDPFFWDLVSLFNVRYSEIFGTLVSRDLPQSHNAFRIDPARLDATLDAIEASIQDQAGSA